MSNTEHEVDLLHAVSCSLSGTKLQKQTCILIHFLSCLMQLQVYHHHILCTCNKKACYDNNFCFCSSEATHHYIRFIGSVVYRLWMLVYVAKLNWAAVKMILIDYIYTYKCIHMQDGLWMWEQYLGVCGFSHTYRHTLATCTTACL